MPRDNPHSEACDFSRPVINKLAVAQSHLNFSQGALFNAQVDFLYLAIDNSIDAVIAAKDPTGKPVRNHKEKIRKFFEYVGASAAKKHSITEDELDKFVSLWHKCRYELYLPNWKEIDEMRMFAHHLYKFVATQLESILKSRKENIDNLVQKELRVFSSDYFRSVCGEIHEERQAEFESLGEVHGMKLGMKLANPWNYIDAAVVTDNLRVRNIIEEDAEIKKRLLQFAKLWEAFVNEVSEKNFDSIIAELAEKMNLNKGNIDEETKKKVKELFMNHPDQGIRLGITLSYNMGGLPVVGEKWGSLLEGLTSSLSRRREKGGKTLWEAYQGAAHVEESTQKEHRKKVSKISNQI